MNIDPNGKGWIDWAATKVSAAHLAGGGGGEGRLSHWPPPPPAALWPDQHSPRHGAIPPLQPGKEVGPSSPRSRAGQAGGLGEPQQLLKGLCLPTLRGGGGFCPFPAGQEQAVGRYVGSELSHCVPFWPLCWGI